MSKIQSSVVLLVVVLVHAGAFYFLASGLRSRHVIAHFTQPQTTLIFIPAKAQKRSRPASTAIINKVASSRAVEPLPDVNANAISAPSAAIHWADAATEAASGLLARRAAEAGRSLDSKPNVIELPKRGVSHRPGDSQRFAGGEVITWIDDQCYVSNQPKAGPQLDPNRPNTACKDPPGVQGDLFDEVKPAYLRASDTGVAESVRDASEHPSAPTCSYSTFKCK